MESWAAEILFGLATGRKHMDEDQVNMKKGASYLRSSLIA
jgi:hypothetical protein